MGLRGDHRTSIAMEGMPLVFGLKITYMWELGSFRPGRQEDAHEYLVALLDAMHEAALASVKPTPSREIARTTLIYQIFGGRLRSQVVSYCNCSLTN